MPSHSKMLCVVQGLLLPTKVYLWNACPVYHLLCLGTWYNWSSIKVKNIIFPVFLLSPQAKKHTARDREGRPVSCVVWGSEGEYLYCGFISGRLLQFHFQFDQEVMKATPLLDCGSPVVQLSVSGRNLLISTLARSLILEADTGRWTQVCTQYET